MLLLRDLLALVQVVVSDQARFMAATTRGLYTVLLVDVVDLLLLPAKGTSASAAAAHGVVASCRVAPRSARLQPDLNCAL